MSKLLIKNIKSIVTVDDEDRVLNNSNIYIVDGVIKHIGKEVFEADEVIDGSNYYAYPGLINTHHHLYQTFSRNLPQVQNLELFPWLKALYEIWKGLDQDMIYYSSMTGIGDLMKNGCTTVFDHHYVFPSSAPGELIDTQFDVASKIGIRLHASRGSMSRSVKDGGLPPDSVVQTTDEILADSIRLIDKYHDPSPFSMRQIVLAPCSPFSVTDDLMIETAKLARSKGVRIHTHLCETLDEENYTLSRYNLRPLAYMESLGWVGSDVWYAHGIHFNDDELKLLAQTQTGIAHCPVSNMKLSSGIARIPDMLKLGVPVGLAVDGSASNDGSNLIEELRVGFLLHRLNSSNLAPTGYDMLKIATRGSAKLLGRTDIGSLEEGKAGDLFMIDSRDLSLIGTQSDPKSIFAVVGYNKPVDYTIVNGKVVVRKGNLVNVDEEEISRKANELVDCLLKKA
ncbi:MAG: 8-oxoguanine deaminase [Firmicutes bacterium]|nr:8-oxoguanine deaminase [Bacillota bacterium]